MTTQNHTLDFLNGRAILTDGGLETTLVFHEGIDLPAFAAFPLLDTPEGREQLARYYRRYIALAEANGRGLLLETPTWRAHADWGPMLGYSPAELDRVNRYAVRWLRDLMPDSDRPHVVGGNIGPRGDGYVLDAVMSAEEAERYHSTQVTSLASAGADLISAYTIGYSDEAIGIVRAAHGCRMPSVMSFTVETDGRLPSGEALGEAIARVDAATDGGPAYYMINCAHPSHFRHVLEDSSGWHLRIRGLRANASCRSHAELDEATELDAGDPPALALDYEQLRTDLPALRVIGGCCGTDHRHVAAISAAFAG